MLILYIYFLNKTKMSQASLKNCTSCTRESDNKEFNCPERMSDGRIFTNNRPRSSTEYYNMVANHMPDAYTNRQYLIANADDLIKRNAAEAYARAACGPCDTPYERGHMLDEVEQQTCDARSCTFRVTDPMGLGRGRYNENMESQAKAAFLQAKTKESEWFAQNSQCCGTKLENLEYFPIGGGSQIQQEYGRYAVPSGATLMTGGSRLNTQGLN